MRHIVRDLYKRFLAVGRDYPAGLDVVRRRTKEEFFRHKDVTDEEEIAHLVHRGRWYLKNEVIGAIQLRKYRTLRKRYGSDAQAPQIDKGPAPPPLRPPLDEISKN